MSRVPGDDPLLGLAVDLCNTYDAYADPPERLTLGFLSRLADHHGQSELGAGFVAGDLDRIRSMRGRLYRVFATDSIEEKVATLNGLLDDHGGSARLVPGERGFRLAAAGRPDPVSRLTVACADALARAIAGDAADRLRTCAANPCRCVYVDRTRANRQRYCCELCNDRMAAAAYRRRRTEPGAS